MQTLHIGQGKYLKVDHSFADAGETAQYGMSGGRRILLSVGSRQKPEIFMCDGGFFYKNGQPVVRNEDIDYLPEPYRELALKFVAKDKKQAAPIAASKEEAVAIAPKRGRGRPKKVVAAAPKKTVIKDEDSLLEAAGYKD
jgi:hypothetical protein